MSTALASKINIFIPNKLPETSQHAEPHMIHHVVRESDGRNFIIVFFAKSVAHPFEVREVIEGGTSYYVSREWLITDALTTIENFKG